MRRSESMGEEPCLVELPLDNRDESCVQVDMSSGEAERLELQLHSASRDAWRQGGAATSAAVPLRAAACIIAGPRCDPRYARSHPGN